ncbi:MAG: alpha-ketoglutarate-dependent dioxygenase AlkB [Cyanobacteriota bacterium]|nr:alpha-ketoglutarate-dependent dioxygenase AlkB [Cyanobacteriota bacterium]
MLQTRQPGLLLHHWPSWLQGLPRGAGAAASADLLKQLQEGLPWRQPVVRVYGRSHPVPRLTCWIGDPGCHYRYSGLLETPLPWSEPLLNLRRQVEAHLGVAFNSLLLNRYRHGQDCMGWHADDEHELAPNHPIASLSLGATRTLRFRPRPGGTGGETFGMELHHGDLLVMHPPTQSHWHHALPPRQRVREERLNLTFRLISLPLAP